MTEEPAELLAIETAEERESFLRLLATLTAALDKAARMTHDSSKWLLGSLLAVNGGALVAFLGSEKMPVTALSVAAPIWLLGIILALAVGVLNQQAGAYSIAMLGRYIGDINSALITGTLIVPDWEGDQLKLTRLQTWPRRIGWASGICFVLGSVAAAFAMR